MASARLYIGQHDCGRDSAVDDAVMQASQDLGFDMVVRRITTPALQERVTSLLVQCRTADKGQSFPILESLSCTDDQTSETHLRPSEKVSRMILVASPWIDLAAPDDLVADASRQVFHLEMQYAAFCGATNVVLPLQHSILDLHSAGNQRCARAIKEALHAAPFVQLHVQLPFDGFRHAGGSGIRAALDVWDAWNAIRSHCSNHPRLSLDLPRQSRWFAEPVRILHFNPEAFEGGRDGIELPQTHRELLWRYMGLRSTPWILVGIHAGQANAARNDFGLIDSDRSIQADSSLINSHLDHLRYLEEQQPTGDAVEEFAAGYQDYLQNPLQPLADNLESITYEVFEKDPVKYEWYERAISLALVDWTERGKPASGPDGRIVVAVAGAGRGPLVSRVRDASKTTGIPTQIWAVEKNANACVVLQRHVYETWDREVTLVQSDMRSWRGPSRLDKAAGGIVHYPVDILVSELLGSFGDNELSPECLDGIDHVLQPVHGVSIPQHYSSYITPISTPKLHMDLQSRFVNGDLEAFSVPYVVFFNAFEYLSLQSGDAVETIPQVSKVWDFVHDSQPKHLPDKTSNGHNTRFARVEFDCPVRGVCHGLAGYFETILFDGRKKHDRLKSNEHPKLRGSWAGPGIIELSTNPLTMEDKSKDMLSWFPILFPLKVRHVILC